MNITVDTKSKTIEIEGSIKLSEIISFMEEHKFNMDEYSVKSKVVIWPSSPITYNPPHYGKPDWMRDGILYTSPGLEVNGTEITVKK